MHTNYFNSRDNHKSIQKQGLMSEVWLGSRELAQHTLEGRSYTFQPRDNKLQDNEHHVSRQQSPQSSSQAKDTTMSYGNTSKGCLATT